MNIAAPLQSNAPAQARFLKVGEDGSLLSPDASKWVAVLDTRSHLMWAVEVLPKQTFAAAADSVAQLRTAGFADWRLPTVEELFCLADRTRRRPAIDTDYFPNTPPELFWSSTPYASSPSGCAWGVDFDFGFSFWYYQDSEGFVRAVRPGQ